MQKDILEKELEMLKMYLVDDISKLSTELYGNCVNTYNTSVPVSVLIDVHKTLRKEQQKGCQSLNGDDNNRGR